MTAVVELVATAMLPVADHVPVAGSYTSAEAGPASTAPATNTLPDRNTMLTGHERDVDMLPVDDHT